MCASVSPSVSLRGGRFERWVGVWRVRKLIESRGVPVTGPSPTLRSVHPHWEFVLTAGPGCSVQDCEELFLAFGQVEVKVVSV